MGIYFRDISNGANYCGQHGLQKNISFIMRFSSHFQMFYFNDRLELCYFFEWKKQKDKHFRYIFTRVPILAEGTLYRLHTKCRIYILPKCFVTNKCYLFVFSIHPIILEKPAIIRNTFYTEDLQLNRWLLKIIWINDILKCEVNLTFHSYAL